MAEHSLPASDKDFALAVWRWGLWGAPLWWVLGLNLVIYHLLSFTLLFIVISRAERKGETVHFEGAGLYLIALTGVYMFSILLHFASSDMSRLLAGTYNLSFWVMGTSLILTLSNRFSLNQSGKFLQSFLPFTFVTGILAILCFFLPFLGFSSVIFETPLYKLGDVLGRTVLVENSLLVNLLQLDWFVSVWRPRFNLYSPYPTAAGAVFLIALVMLVTWARMEKKTASPFVWFLVLPNLLGLFMTLSRISMLALGVSVTVIFFLQMQRAWIWIFLLLLGLIAALPLLDQWTTFLWGLREGSSVQRLELYQYSLQQLEGADWILGLGLKPREEAFRFPLGSHSTYLSMLFKTGVVGLIIFLAFQLHLALRWYQLKNFLRRSSKEFFLWQGFGMVFFGMAVWMITEDIDAPQLLAYLYFSIIGVFEGFHREVRLCNPSILPQRRN